MIATKQIPNFRVRTAGLENPQSFATFVVKDVDEMLPLSTMKIRDKPVVKGFLRYVSENCCLAPSGESAR